MSDEQRKNGRDFLEKYFNAHVSRGKKKFHSVYPMDYWNTVSREPLDDYMNIKSHVEESVDISLREQDFERLLDVLGYFQNYNDLSRYYKELESKLAFERKLRNSNPALQKAYEKYTLLVSMVANGKEIED